MKIRTETPDDYRSIRKIHTAAFKSDKEADLVNTLRDSGLPLCSLVAEADSFLTGHILFSPVRLEGCDEDLIIYGMGPLAVRPEFQKQGVGSALVAEGLKACGRAGIDSVVVLGHPDYYPRFGFEPSRKYKIQCEYDVPDHFFMILELTKGCLKHAKGTIRFHEAFNAV